MGRLTIEPKRVSVAGLSGSTELEPVRAAVWMRAPVREEVGSSGNRVGLWVEVQSPAPE